MTSTSASTAVPPAETALDVCTACPHPLAAHDPISLRFCRATVASSGEHPTRGCVCPSS